MADRNRELVPDNWSLVRERAELVPGCWILVHERALTSGLGAKGWYSGVCRRAELP